MCELMGYSFAQPIVADFSIREFATRGEENADGWGLAWYPDRSVALIKEAVQWKASKHTGFLESYSGIRSSICLAHVRHLTTGQATHADTHPFARELLGTDFCFAHNGTLPAAHDLPLGRFRPVGGTDSEHFFCHLLEEIAGWEEGLAEKSWPRLHQKLASWNEGGKLNCLLADGQRLFCYHDAAGWKGLHFRRLFIHDQETRRFEDPQVRLDLGNGAVNSGVVVATSPLSLTGWETFLTGELVVLEGGVIRFSSHRQSLAGSLVTKTS
jgi:glutamine amidotransferase